LFGNQKTVSFTPVAVKQVLIAVGSYIVAPLLYLQNGFLKRRVAVKPPGKKEGGLDLLLQEGLGNKAASITIFITGKYKGQFFLCAVPPDNTAMA
jgi:hypothetical protein